MKNLEKAAIVMVVLWVVALCSMLYPQLALRYLSGYEGMMEWQASRAFALLGQTVVRLLVQIGVGVWLFVLAKKQGGTPWIWLLFGLTFGLVAAVLFFLSELYKRLAAQSPTASA